MANKCGKIMTHPNKVRGNNLEREIVNKAKAKGLSAKRAYASDGRSLGKSEVVDVMVEVYVGFGSQCASCQPTSKKSLSHSRHDPSVLQRLQ